MDPIDAFWHLLNFFAPALGVGLLAPAFAKVLWRRDLTGVSWLRLSSWAVAGCAAVLIAGLVIFGHDGKIATYAAMTAVCALTMWLVAFGPVRH